MSIKYKGQTISESPGVGVPGGGTTGQILTKKSDADFDAHWVDAPTGEGSGEVYSTEEIRIGTWIDGKPLYRKTFHCTSPSDSNGGSHKYQEVYVENWDVVHSHGFVADSSGFKYPLPASWCIFYPSFSGAILEYAFEGNGPLRLRVTSSSGIDLFNSKPVTLIVEYTKTTDEATRTITFAQPTQGFQIDTLGMTLTPAATSAATEILKEKS